ncbi:MAG: hypothetical protein CL709_00965 [Chloroflexi bacterium]|nr:hypothetical protein [Chloroflexota bacterium]
MRFIKDTFPKSQLDPANSLCEPMGEGKERQGEERVVSFICPGGVGQASLLVDNRRSDTLRELHVLKSPFCFR